MPIVGSVQYERAWVSPTLVRQWLRMHVCVLSYVYSLVLQWYDIVFSRDIYIPNRELISLGIIVCPPNTYPCIIQQVASHSDNIIICGKFPQDICALNT